MFEWLKSHTHEVNINLWFFSIKLGPKKTSAPIVEPGPRPIPSPPAPEPEPEPDPEPEPMPDPLLRDEPEIDERELDHLISLEGTAFDRALRGDEEVAKRLSHKRDTFVANKAVTYFIQGHPEGTEYEKRRVTWTRARAACHALVIERLDQYHQRATYAALAGIVGGMARSVMSGKPKIKKNSWVVSKLNHLPTGYSESEIHPSLKERDRVLETPNELREWLRNPA